MFASPRHLLLLIFSAYLAVPGLKAQNQALADSMEAVYHKGAYDWQEELKILKTLAEEQSEPDKKLRFSQELIEMGLALDSFDYAFSGYLQKGNALRLKGDMPAALENYFDAASLAVERDMKRGHGAVSVAIADVYSIMGNHGRSVEYYHQAIEILQRAGDSISLASAYLNAGDEFFNYGSLDSALIYFEKSGNIFRALDYELGVAYNLGNMGLVYARRGENAKAEDYIGEAVDLLRKLEDYYPISVYLTFMADIYMERGDESSALDFGKQSLALAKTHGLRDQISEANLKLSELHEQMGNYREALKYYKNHVTFRDSVRNIETVQEMANLRADYEVAQKQIEVDLLNQQKRNQTLVVIIISIVLLLIGLIAVVLYRQNRFIKRTNAIIENEKERSEELLLNILPAETAQELKESGSVGAKKFDSVTVMFADFKDFTPFAETAGPEQLVKTVDYYFSQFDRIMEKYGLEKIKTIGDAYMAAGGLPFPDENHALNMVRAAREMIEFVEKTKTAPPENVAIFELRIGINTGPVVAGVIGIRKFAYDIWGHTVNIASRMESASEPGRINVSEHTYELIKDRFECNIRGAITVKAGKALKMYFVDK